MPSLSACRVPCACRGPQATSNLNWILSKRGLIFKLAFQYGCRTWIQSFVMLPLLWSAQAGGDTIAFAKLWETRWGPLDRLVG